MIVHFGLIAYIKTIVSLVLIGVLFVFSSWEVFPKSDQGNLSDVATGDTQVKHYFNTQQYWFFGPDLDNHPSVMGSLKFGSIRLVDSVVFEHKNSEVRIEQSPFNDVVQLVFDDTTICTNLNSFGETFESIKTTSKPQVCGSGLGKTLIDSIVFPGEGCSNMGKIYFQKMLEVNGVKYRPMIVNQMISLAFENDSIVWIYLLYSSFKDIERYEEYTQAHGLSCIGQFKLQSDTLSLIKITDMIPYKDFLAKDNRYLAIYPSLVSDGQSLFLGFNFLDTIYQFDFSGNIVSTIGLPKYVDFKYYRHLDTDEYSFKQLQLSEREGSQTIIVSYNEQINTLNVITLDGDPEIREKANFPPFDDKDWFLSVYDLNTKRWVSSIRFNKKHSFRHVLAYDDKVYVRRMNGDKLMFDVYEVF